MDAQVGSGIANAISSSSATYGSTGNPYLAGISAVASALPSFLGSDNKGVSWNTFDRAQDQADAANPREVARQGDFLKGMAPAQGDAYNTYEDATYGADTQRQISRIQTESKQLGMSPWELTGSSGATPVPSPVMGGNANPASGSNSLSSLLPLATTKMQNDTAKTIAGMNNQTSLQQTAMQTGNQVKVTNITTANGTVPMNQAAQTAAQTLQTQAQTTLTKEQTNLVQDQALQTTVQTFLQALPKDTISIGPYTRTESVNWQALIKAANGNFNNAWSSLGNDGIQTLVNKIKTAVATGGNTIADTIGSGWNALKNGTANFLHGQ